MKKKHYFLVCGQIIFHTNDGENHGQVTLNALIDHDSRNFPARLIGRAQQALQLHFFKKLEDPTTITVDDVPILSVSHLGIMSEKEFHATPDGMQLVERIDGPNPFADADKPTIVDPVEPSVN